MRTPLRLLSLFAVIVTLLIPYINAYSWSPEDVEVCGSDIRG
jgi:hypothetical protein